MNDAVRFLMLGLVIAMWVGSSRLHGGVPVSEDGAQLALINNINTLTTRIQQDQQLSQQHLARIRAMMEGSKRMALAMSQMQSLTKHGQLLTQGPDGQNSTSTAGGLSFDGQNYNGGNFNFIDNLMGRNGLIPFDRLLPTTLVPLSGALLQQALQSMSNFTRNLHSSSSQSFLHSFLGGLASTGINLLAGRATNQFKQFVQGPSTGILGDGVYVRPYQGVVDDAYVALVQGGGPAQKLQFYGQQNLGGQGYNVILGASGDAGSAQINLDNALSTGASQAYEQYRQTQGAGVPGNPYQGYANQIVPKILDVYEAQAPGTELVPTRDQIAQARASGAETSSSATNYPSLFSQSNMSGTDLPNSPLFGPTASSLTTGSGLQSVAVVTPPNAEAQNYQRRIAESDKRLQDITSAMKTQQEMVLYVEQLIQSLHAVHDEVSQLQQSANQTDPNSIPELTTLQRDIQSDLETRQRDWASLTLAVEKLSQERHAELESRADFVEDQFRLQNLRGMPQWRQSLVGG